MTVGTCSVCHQEKNLRIVRGKPICARCYRADISNRKEGQRQKLMEDSRMALERLDSIPPHHHHPHTLHQLELLGGSLVNYFDRIHQNQNTLELVSNLSRLPLTPFPLELVRYLTLLQQELTHQQQRDAWQEISRSKIHKRIASILDRRVELQETIVNLLNKRLSSLARLETDTVEQINRQLEALNNQQLELDRELRAQETELVRRSTEILSLPGPPSISSSASFDESRSPSPVNGRAVSSPPPSTSNTTTSSSVSSSASASPPAPSSPTSAGSRKRKSAAKKSSKSKRSAGGSKTPTDGDGADTSRTGESSESSAAAAMASGPSTGGGGGVGDASQMSNNELNLLLLKHEMMNGLAARGATPQQYQHLFVAPPPPPGLPHSRSGTTSPPVVPSSLSAGAGSMPTQHSPRGSQPTMPSIANLTNPEGAGGRGGIMSSTSPGSSPGHRNFQFSIPPPVHQGLPHHHFSAPSMSPTPPLIHHQFSAPPALPQHLPPPQHHLQYVHQVPSFPPQSQQPQAQPQPPSPQLQLFPSLSPQQLLPLGIQPSPPRGGAPQSFPPSLASFSLPSLTSSSNSVGSGGGNLNTSTEGWRDELSKVDDLALYQRFLGNNTGNNNSSENTNNLLGVSFGDLPSLSSLTSNSSNPSGQDIGSSQAQQSLPALPPPSVANQQVAEVSAR